MPKHRQTNKIKPILTFSVVLLRCHTAYIGLAVEAAVFFLFSSKDSRIQGFKDFKLQKGERITILKF